MIYTDLDGVLRDLAGTVLGHEATTYDELTPDGITIVGFVNSRLSELLLCSEAEYAPAFYGLPFIHIISHQFPSWRPYTLEWIATHLESVPVKYVTFVDHTEEKLAILRNTPGSLLVEDYPRFSSYDRIVLVDKPYNRAVTCKVRVHDTLELSEILWTGHSERVSLSSSHYGYGVYEIPKERLLAGTVPITWDEPDEYERLPFKHKRYHEEVAT